MMKQSASNAVSEAIRERIVNGAYPLGKKLPTEQALCDEFSVGRSTIREAMRMLEAKGYVSIRPGSGTVAVSKTADTAQHVRQWLAENRGNLSDFMEVRVAIESLAIRLFIAKYSQAKFEKLLSIQERFERAVAEGDVSGMAFNDEALHAAIALGAENSLLVNINKQLLDAFRQYRHITFENVEGRSSAVNLHREILKAVELRDTQTALFRIQQHLNTSLENALANDIP